MAPVEQGMFSAWEAAHLGTSPARHRPSASASPVAASCTAKPDGPSTVLAVRVPRPPETPAEPPKLPYRGASPLLPLSGHQGDAWPGPAFSCCLVAPLARIPEVIRCFRRAAYQGRQVCLSLGMAVIPEVPRHRGAAATARAHPHSATFLRCIALPAATGDRSLTSPQPKLIRIGTRVLRHARAMAFQLAEVAVTGPMVRVILAAIHRLRAPP